MCMFFRIHKFIQNGKEYRYLRLVENYRVNGKARQRVIANLGNILKLDTNKTKYLSNYTRILTGKYKSKQGLHVSHTGK